MQPKAKAVEAKYVVRPSRRDGDDVFEEIVEETFEGNSANQYSEGATTMLRKPRVEYELKLIDGQLALVEVLPEPSFFICWFLAYGNALRHYDHFM
jgi:hypothetical protein